MTLAGASETLSSQVDRALLLSVSAVAIIGSIVSACVFARLVSGYAAMVATVQETGQ